MVVSNINNDVSYPERKVIDDEDKGQDVSMYQIKLFDMDVVIALGNIKYNFSKKFNSFRSLINKKNFKRINCILLPIDAVLKALK